VPGSRWDPPQVSQFFGIVGQLVELCGVLDLLSDGDTGPILQEIDARYRRVDMPAPITALTIDAVGDRQGVLNSLIVRSDDVFEPWYVLVAFPRGLDSAIALACVGSAGIGQLLSSAKRMDRWLDLDIMNSCMAFVKSCL
jgi:hypothetical protein